MKPGSKDTACSLRAYCSKAETHKMTEPLLPTIRRAAVVEKAEYQGIRVVNMCLKMSRMRPRELTRHL